MADAAEKYGRGWRPTESRAYAATDDKNVFIRPGMPTEIPTGQGAFTVTLTQFGGREIAAPEGYQLPKALGGEWVSLSDAIKAVRRWEQTGETLVPEQEQIALPLTASELSQLKGGRA